MPSTRKGSANAALAALLKTQGNVGGGAAFRGPPKPRLRTGVFGLDLAMGGGFPVGGVVEYWGDPRSGKTTSAHRTVAAFQRVCRRCLRVARGVTAVAPENENDRWEAEGFCDCVARGISRMPPAPARDKSAETAKQYKERVEAWSDDFQENSYEESVCAWIDTEGAYDSSWAERLGVDPRRVLLVSPTSAEYAADDTKTLIWEGGVDFIVIDSLAQFTPRKEIEESMEQAHQGLGARIINRMIRTLMAGQAEILNLNHTAGIPHGVSQIWVNQIRQKIGVSYGDPSTKPGGLGQGFASKVEIRFMTPVLTTVDVKFAGEKDKYKSTTSEEFHLKVLKNTTATGLRKLETVYKQLCVSKDGKRPGDTEDEKYIFNLATHHGIVTKTGKAGPYHVAGIEGVEFKTQAEIMDMLLNDFVNRRIVEDQIIEAMVSKR